MVSSGGGGFEFGVDPNEDPELALALRVSMEEQRARQEAESRQQGGEAMEAESGGRVVAPSDPSDDADPNSEEALLRRALAMSMEPEGAQTSGGAPAQRANDEPNLAAMTEDEQIAYAMRMSMQEEAGPSAGAAKSEAMEVDDEAKEDYSQEMNDPDFLKVRGMC